MVKRGGSGARVRHRDLRSFLDTFKAPARYEETRGRCPGESLTSQQRPTLGRLPRRDRGTEVGRPGLRRRRGRGARCRATAGRTATAGDDCDHGKQRSSHVRHGPMPPRHVVCQNGRGLFRSLRLLSLGLRRGSRLRGGCLDATEVGQKLGETAGRPRIRLGETDATASARAAVGECLTRAAADDIQDDENTSADDERPNDAVPCRSDRQRRKDRTDHRQNHR
jgi:hypothetical protein